MTKQLVRTLQKKIFRKVKNAAREAKHRGSATVT